MSTMYNLRPLVPPSNEPVAVLPTCMYNMKSLHPDQGQGHVNGDDLADLEQRQGRILSRLSELQKRVEVVRGDLGLDSDNNRSGDNVSSKSTS